MTLTLPQAMQRAFAAYRQGALGEAELLCRRVLDAKADHFDALSMLGFIAAQAQHLQDAADLLGRAVAVNPTNAAAHSNYGNALKELKRLDEALASYDRALTIKPDFADAYNNRGVTLQELKRLEEALASYDRALTIKPDYAEAYNNRGDVLIRLGRLADAAQCFDQLLKLAPDFGFVKGRLLHAKTLSCEWTELRDLCESIRQDIAHSKPTIVPFEYQGISDSEQDLRTCAEVYAAASFPRSAIQLHTKKTERHGKIRLGYLSGEFRNQATSILIAELFELHSKERFETFAFDNGWDDGSDIRARLNSAFDEIIDIRRVPDLEAATLINAREVDILVNLNGYFGEARQGIFAYRPSPIQVNYLGFPGTLGAEYIDYLIADSTVIPDTSRQHYSEKIAYLPHSYQVNDRKRAIAKKTFSREELGLPRTGFVFCCFNNNYKIIPGTFDSWMRILKRVDGSVLWLLEDNLEAAGNLRKEALARGVIADRLVFAKRLPPAEHLARHAAADLFLDTLPYNAHTTASDALWVGLPLVTCVGQTFPGRVAASLLKAIDLHELVTTTQEQYEALAIELATDPQRLRQIRQKLERNRMTTPLFDTRSFTKYIEDAYTQMYERYQADLPPDHIFVSP